MRPLHPFSLLLLLGAALTIPGCSPRDSARAGAASGSDTGRAAAAATDSAAASGVADDPTTWRVTPAGIGPVRAGMRFADAAPLLGVAPAAGTGNEACAYVRPANGPAGVSVMVRGGEVARVQVDSGAVRTVEGAGIGDSEARIDSIYHGRVTVGPHKYTEGAHYLTVKPAGDESAFRLLFETDGRRVTRYRAGRLPEVEWVEGCA